MSAGRLGWGLDRCLMECARLSPRVFSSPVCLPAGGPGLAQEVQDARLDRFPCLWTRPLGGIGVAATSAAIWLFGRAGAGQRGAA